MQLYALRDAIFFSKDKSLPLRNENGQDIGLIRRETVPGYEKNHVFSYSPADGQAKVTVGIKKGGLSRFMMAKYGVIADGQELELKDKLGNNFLYFCVTGKIGDRHISFEENWSRDVELRIEKHPVAFIQKKKRDLHATFQFEEEIKENSLLFSMTILMYFMLKIYKDETEVFQDLLMEAD